jgi:hypothetical protein
LIKHYFYVRVETSFKESSWTGRLTALIHNKGEAMEELDWKNPLSWIFLLICLVFYPYERARMLVRRYTSKEQYKSVHL